MLPGHKYTVEDVLGILWRRKWLIVLPLVICSVGTLIVSRRMPNIYRSETLILVVPQKVPESYVRSTVSGTIEDRLSSLKQQILSRSRLERVVTDLDLYADLRRTRPMEAAIESMRAAVKVDIVRGGEAFTVAYDARDPVVAKTVTERVASMFIEENVHDRATLAIGTSDFLQTQLDDARQRLIEQERRVKDYRLQYSTQLPSQAAFNLQAMQTSRIQLQTIDAAQLRARDRQVTLERQLGELLAPETQLSASHSAVAVAAPVSDDPLRPTGATTSDQLADGRQKLAALEARGFKAEHPDVVQLRRRVAQLEAKSLTEPATRSAAPTPRPADPGAVLRERRARELRADLDAIKREIASNDEQQRKAHQDMAEYQSRLDAAPIREAELTELTRDYETTQQIYRALLAKREDSKVAANLEQRQIGEQFRVLDPARVPQAPFKPNRLLINAAGAIFGLLLGLGGAALLEYLDTTLKTEDDVRMLLNLPVIATIPVLAQQAEPPRALRRRVVAALRG